MCWIPVFNLVTTCVSLSIQEHLVELTFVLLGAGFAPTYLEC